METSIAENIRAYRKQRGLTQEQLVEALGVSVGAVYKWGIQIIPARAAAHHGDGGLHRDTEIGGKRP